MTGRTLFGAKPPKGQETGRPLFRRHQARVLPLTCKIWTKSLWKLGILAKTKHNEVAPAQHELAPIFGDCQHRRAITIS